MMNEIMDKETLSKLATYCGAIVEYVVPIPMANCIVGYRTNEMHEKNLKNPISMLFKNLTCK
jgi:hypothetical protein